VSETYLIIFLADPIPELVIGTPKGQEDRSLFCKQLKSGSGLREIEGGSAEIGRSGARKRGV